MDLSDMMNDKPLANFDWLINPETFEPKDKTNSCKEELAVEWGRIPGNIGEVEPITIMDEMEVEQSDKDVDTLIEYATIMIHQGIVGKQLMSEISYRFPYETIQKSIPELRELVKFEGILGCVVVDMRNEKIKDRIIAAVKKNPFGKNASFVLMTDEQKQNSSNVMKRKISSDSSMKKGSIDNFFKAEEDNGFTEYVYAPMNLPIIAFEGEIDPTWVDQRIIDIAELKAIDEVDVEELNSIEDPCERIKLAFKKALKNRKSSSVVLDSLNAENKASDYVMNPTDMKIEAPVKLMSDLYVESMSNLDVVLDPEMIVDEQLAMNENLKSTIEGFELQNVPMSDLEVDHNSSEVKIDSCNVAEFGIDFFSENNGAKIVDFDINDEIASEGVLTIDGFGDQQDIPLSNVALDFKEINLDQVIDPELEGCMDISLDDIKSKYDLDISLEGGMIID